jgi:hypothetical protein
VATAQRSRFMAFYINFNMCGNAELTGHFVNGNGAYFGKFAGGASLGEFEAPGGKNARTEHLHETAGITDGRVQVPNSRLNVIQGRLPLNHANGDFRWVDGDRTAIEMCSDETEQAIVRADIEEKHAGCTVRNKIIKFSAFFRFRNLRHASDFVRVRVHRDSEVGRKFQSSCYAEGKLCAVGEPFERFGGGTQPITHRTRCCGLTI